MSKQFRKITEGIPFYSQVQEYLEWCKSRQSEVTIKGKYWTYARLYQETGIRDINQLTNGLVEAWLASMAKHGAGPVALNRAMTNIKSLVHWHREMGNNQIPIKLMLLERVKEHEKEQVFYMRHKIKKVIGHTKDPKTRLMIRICFDTGIRASEMTRLRLSDFSGQKLTFRAKGGKIRRTYISRRTQLALKRYIKEYNITDFLWPGNHKGHIAYKTFLRRIQKPFFELGMNDFHPHALRHSFVADLEYKGASNDEIQVLIDHSNPKTTLRYRHQIRKDIYLQGLTKKYHKWLR